MATTPPADHAIRPDSTALALLVCAVVFAAAAAVALGLRLGLRARDRMLGWDDALMALGLAFHLALASVAAFGTFRGVGAGPGVFEARDREANGYFTEMVQLVFLITIRTHAPKSDIYRPEGEETIDVPRAIYAVVLVSVKSAVCLLLLRVASAVRLYRRCVLGTLAVTAVVFVVTEVGALGHCRPLEANWKAAARVPGACYSQHANVVVAAFATVFAVATDWFCALFPVLMVWRMPMPRTSKVAVAAALGLGVFASVCPLVRVRYVLEYSRIIGHKEQEPWTHVIGSLILWSVLECGIGLIAASLPAIWHGCRRWRRHSRLLGGDAAHNREMVAAQLAMQDQGLKPSVEANTSSHGLLDGAQNPPQSAQPGV